MEKILAHVKMQFENFFKSVEGIQSPELALLSRRLFTEDVRIHSIKFPSRPGKTPCGHFLRTGKCGFPACKFDHPRKSADMDVATSAIRSNRYTEILNWHAAMLVRMLEVSNISEEPMDTSIFLKDWLDVVIPIIQSNFRLDINEYFSLAEIVLDKLVVIRHILLPPSHSNFPSAIHLHFASIFSKIDVENEQGEACLITTLAGMSASPPWMELLNAQTKSHSETEKRFCENQAIVKEGIRVNLLAELLSTWPNHSVLLIPFGSSANSIGSLKSDLDLCLILEPLYPGKFKEVIKRSIWHA